MATVETSVRIAGYEVHEAANLLPMMSETELASLVENIRRHGQIEPGALLNGKLLDARNRGKACERLGIELKVRELPPDTNPWDYVVSANVERRELDQYRKAAIRLACLTKSDAWIAEREAKAKAANEARSKSVSEARSIQNRSKSESGAASQEAGPEPKRTAALLAEQFGVSKSTIERALELQRKNPAAFEKVCAGEAKGHTEWKALRNKKPESVGLVGALIDTEIDGALSITTNVEAPEPINRKRYGKAPDLDTSILNQAKDFSYAWELILKREDFAEQWVAVQEAQRLTVIAELRNLKNLTLQLLRKLEGKNNE